MKYFFLLFLLFTLSACGPDYLYEEEQALPQSGWSYADGQEFAFTIEDTSQFYALHLRLDHSPEFFAQNLYVKVFTTFPSGEELEEEVSLQLADKFGQWYGDCNAEKCRIDIPIQPVAYFERAGEYRIRVDQHSRREPLDGVSTVGFAVEVLKDLPES